MYTIKNKIYQNTINIKNSEFITIIGQVKTKQDIKDFLNKYSKKDATHNCYAYKIGFEQVNASFNDDGEPSGSAGKPILNVINKQNLTNIIILVIRYYGGKKLGIGPLTRVYSKCTSQTLLNIEKIIIKNTFKVTFLTTIQNMKNIDKFLLKVQSFNINKTFKNNVEYSLLTDYPDIFKAINLKIFDLKIEKISTEL